MISFAEKDAVASSFAELARKEVSMGRVNYHYEGSVREKKIVVYHLHPNGNGFVYAELLEGYETDAKGFVNIRNYGADELRELIRRSIRSLGPEEEAEEDALRESSPDGAPDGESEGSRDGAPDGEGFTKLRERWKDGEGHILEVHLEPEDGMWYVFAGEQLDSAFETYEEAVEYLREEGFRK